MWSFDWLIPAAYTHIISCLILLYYLFQAQIHLIGNPVSWAVANLGLLAYQLLAAVYLLRRRRGFKDLPDGTVTGPGSGVRPASDDIVQSGHRWSVCS